MGLFNCVRRVGVMPTSMRRNYATPASVRHHFNITCLLGGYATLVVWDHRSCKTLRCPPSRSVSSRYVPYLYIDWIAFPFPKNMLQFIAEIMHPIGYRKVKTYSRTQWLEHWWLVYHGYFELVLESLTKNPITADFIAFGIISSEFIFYIDDGMLCVFIRIAST